MSKRFTIEPSEWVWHGMPGHFVAANHCRFHLHTTVGRVRVSTVGAMYLERVPGIDPNEMQTVGLGRHYETMVCLNDGNGGIAMFELDFAGLNLDDFVDPYEADKEAERIHLKMCETWCTKEKQEEALREASHD